MGGRTGSRYDPDPDKVNLALLAPSVPSRRGAYPFVCDEVGCGWTAVCSKTSALRHGAEHVRGAGSKTGVHVYQRLTPEQRAAREVARGEARRLSLQRCSRRYREKKKAAEGLEVGGTGRAFDVWRGPSLVRPLRVGVCWWAQNLAQGVSVGEGAAQEPLVPLSGRSCGRE